MLFVFPAPVLWSHNNCLSGGASEVVETPAAPVEPVEPVAPATDVGEPIEPVAALGDVAAMAPATDVAVPAAAVPLLFTAPASPDEDSMSKKSTLELSPGVMDALVVGAPTSMSISPNMNSSS